MKNGKHVKSDGTIEWYKDDLLHREDGPAYQNYEMRIKAWFLNGVQHNQEEFNEWLAKKELNDKLINNLEEKPVVKKNKI